MSRFLFLHCLNKFNIIDGNLPTILDLFYFSRKLGLASDCILFVPDDVDQNNAFINRKYFLDDFIAGRYINGLPPYKYIIYRNNRDIVKQCLYKYSYCILTDFSYSQLMEKRIQLSIQEYMVITSWFSFYHASNYNENVSIYNENYLCGKVNYIKKIYKPILGNVENARDRIFVLANGERRLVQKELADIRGKYRGELVLCQDKLNGLNTSGYTVFNISNRLFDYTTYLYVPTKTYEFAPRMLLESTFLGKNVLYYKYPENRNQRFEDIKNNNIEKYLLTEKDTIIQRLLSS